MRAAVVCVILSSLLVGCGSVIDPAPFEPVTAQRFNTLEAASATLRSMATEYANERDALIRQQYAFDIPIFGLALATGGAAIGHAATKTVAALGLGAAGVTAARVYVSPQTRAAAYNGAALGLSCGGGVAGRLAIVKANEDAQSTATALSNALSSAKPNDLDVAAGQKALTDLYASMAVVTGAPARLQGFASAVVRGTTSRAQTGVQNIDATTAAIRAAAPASGSSRSSSQAPAPAVAAAIAPGPTKTLQQLTSEAAGISKDINDAWGELTSCTAQSTSS